MSISFRLRAASMRRGGHRWTAAAAALASLAGFVAVAPGASASSVTSAVFSGTTGTVSVGGTLYAKQGAALTLAVVTSTDTKCVAVTGAATLTPQTSSTAKANWTFTTTAPAGDGAQAFTVAASPNFNSNNCTGQTNSTQASYTLDNTGPVVTAALTPAANAAGWNNSDVTVKWTATDTGSGVTAAQPFQTDGPITANGIVTKTAPAQSDRLGNTGASGSVTVRVDKAAPTISSTQTDNGDGTVTVTFTCNDSNSGGGQASGIASCVADGTSPASSSKTVAAGTTVTGTATDLAGNTSTASVVTKRADSTAPTITHNVSPAPNAAGWNKADATVTFSCADETGGSGLKSCLVDGGTTASKTISTETNGTLVSGTATDNAGNVSKDSVTVKLDKTVPTISASADRAANTAGWYTNNVTVSFICNDPGTQASGVKSCPAAQTLSTDGAAQSASGTATDNADNTSASASVTGINIDKTAPVLTGAFPTGWQNGDVTVTWSCKDATSGASDPAPTTVTGEGSNLSATTTCTDKAGNSTQTTVSGIKIDRTAPTTGISGTSNNWTNGNITVTLAPTDGGSGVASTTYTIDGGAQQNGTSFTLSTEGDHTVTFFSTDNAGNKEAVQTAHVKIDKTAPTIGHTFVPSGYTDGAWTNQDVTVTFNCADQSGSGVASCTGSKTVTTEGTAQQVTGTATDNAGNTATDTASVSIDKTKPTIVASVDRAANPAGWYNSNVTVSYHCDDDRSGVASCPASKTLTEGANQSTNGTATDNAGNSANDGVSAINIDETNPTLTGSFSSGWHTGDVTVNWNCTDAGSGPAAQPADSTVTGEGANLSATTTCADKAGNTTTKTVDGIQIDRTAPTTGVSVSGQLKNGWYNAGVDVTLSASDNLSQINKTYFAVDGGAPQVYTVAVPVAEDGTHTITYWSTDNAGNVEDKTGNSLTLKIDKTPPTLTGAATTAPNGNNGWYTHDVTVGWTCSDNANGSGIDGTCPSDSTVTGEGDNLSATQSVSDLAGNPTSTTVKGIEIDSTAPTTTVDVPAVPASGWYGDAVQVTLSGHDNLSGIDNTYYTVDGGATQTYGGAFSFGTEGTHEIAFWSKDNAGNVETAGAPITLKVDQVPPTTTVINPLSPASGWYVNSGIPVAFSVNDDASGIKATYYSIDGGAAQTYGEPFTADLSDGSHQITYWSVDLAGNVEPHATTNTIAVQVDTTPPTISGSKSPGPNGFGWNNTNVAVNFTCSDDGGSGVQTGVAGCGPNQTVSAEGPNQSVQGDTADVAGNKASTTVDNINIDKTAPTLTGAATTDPNSAGWYHGDVTIAWTGKDGLSNIDASTQPANSTISGEGTNLGASASISDKAGNKGTGSVSGIKIDRTGPSLSGKATTQPNSAGWYQKDVEVDFSCSDPALADGSAGSGFAYCPTSKAISGDGMGKSVTSDAATDVAGNSTPGVTVGGINIDGTAPVTTANNQCTSSNSWCTGTTATVALTATDNLSGVSELHYAVNGGTEQVVTAATQDFSVPVNVSVPLSGSGTATVKYWSVDIAGNVEAANTASLKYDNIAPTVTHVLSPLPNANDWNNSDVTVTFSAKDDDSGSGVASVTSPVTVSAETPGQLVTGTATDTAGNKGTDSVTVKLDKTKPTITAAVTSGTKVNGWYTNPITVHFTCFDALSGIPATACPSDVTLSTSGANQPVSGTVADAAGNSATANMTVSIDNENPTITNVNVSNGFYTLGSVPNPTCTASDSFSGVSSCTVAVTGGTANGVGTFNYTATAKDNAGNWITQTGTYKVVYRWDGFLQPINDTAHQVGTSISIFKAGSTIPVKFQLKKADGTVVQANTAPVWFVPVKGAAMSMPVDDSAPTATADSGTTYKYDSTAQQYIYNWKTGTGGSYWRIGVTLDDGQTYYVNIGLR